MIVQLIAMGMFDTPAGNVVTPPERIIALTRSAGFVTASHVVDPYDVLNFKLDLSALLEEDEAFVSATLEVLPAAALLGFSIIDAGQYAPQQIDDSHILIWPQIAAPNQANAAWAGQGSDCGFEITMITDSTPPRKWQRTVNIRWAQK